MKILFVIDSFYTTNNGTSISAQRFAGELRKRGHEVRVLCWDTPRDQGTKDQVTKEVESNQGCTKENNLTDGDFTTKKFNIPVFQPLCDKHDFSFAYNNKELVHRACDWADIVHIFVPFGIEMEAIRYCRQIGKPVTAAFHIQPENMTSSVSMGKVEWFNELFYKSFRHNIYNRVRHVHVPSKFMGDMIAARGYTAKIHVISNGIQDAFMEAGEKKVESLKLKVERSLKVKGERSLKVESLKLKVERSLEEDSSKKVFKIMMIGRLSQEKRQDVIINALKYSKYGDRIQLVFAGRGPEYDKYVELGKDLKYPPKFIYVGRDELIKELLTTDLYVHASDMESEAISCIEAFATGLVPVIANSYASATPQFALDGRSLFMPGDPKDLARAIDYWLDHPEERLEMEERYRQAGRRYSLAASVTAFEEMLNEEIQDNEEALGNRAATRESESFSHRPRRVAALW